MILRKVKTFFSLLGKPGRLAQVFADKRSFRQNKVYKTEAFYCSIRRRIEVRYRKLLGIEIEDLDRPSLYTEKAQWRKLYCPEVNQLGKVTDKIKIYEYAHGKTSDRHLIPIIWSGDTVDADFLRNLGDNIVLQPTHRSGQVVFIENSKDIDYHALVGWFERMLAWPYSMVGQEPWYGRITPRIIARPLIKDSDGSTFLLDVKFHVFRQPDGSQVIVVTCINRNPRWLAVFDEKYHHLPYNWASDVFPPPEHDPPKPAQWEEMVEDARRLAGDFDYVRVDFMLGAQEYYFTELTFAPGGGYSLITPTEWDRIVGSYWHLDTGTPIKRLFWFSRTWLPLWRTERPMRNLRRLYRYRDDWSIRAIQRSDYDRRYQEGGELYSD